MEEFIYLFLFLTQDRFFLISMKYSIQSGTLTPEFVVKSLVQLARKREFKVIP